MTLINSWTRNGGAAGVEACLQCDGCTPPHLAVGTDAEIRAGGWRFSDFESGPHWCEYCAHAQERRRRAPAERRPALPNLLVVGAEKCGTTSLHEYLGLHPEIQMSGAKEMHFFQDPGCSERLDEYASFFDARAAVRGESSPVYTAFPLVEGIPERIRAIVPDAKLIYIVRDPVERTVASYVSIVANNVGRPSPQEAFRDVDDPHNPYLAPSRYATQLERYRATFNLDRIMVLDQRDLLELRQRTLQRVFRFLGVDSDFESPGFDELLNTRSSKRRVTAAGERLRHSYLAHAARKLPAGPRDAVIGLGKRMTSERLDVFVDDTLRSRIADSLRDEADAFRQLTGESFEDWQI